MSIYNDSTTPRTAPGSAAGAAAQQAADQARIFGTPAPTATPTPTPTATPTITTVPPRTPGLLQSAQDTAAAAAASRASAQSQADSYAATMRQQRIDAINTTFAPRIQREEVAGDARMSRVAALNLKSGVVGSGVDTTKLGEQKGLNEKAVRALEDEKATAINEAFGWADQLARQRAEDIYKTTTEGANANVNRYKEQTATAMEALKVFGSQNITAESLKVADPNTYNTLRDVSGMSDAQIDAYLKVNAPEGTYQWSAAEINGSTMYVPKIVNGKLTMDKLDLGYTPKKEKKVSSTVKTDNGVLIIYADGTYDTVGGGSNSGVTLKSGAPSWEQFLAAAEEEEATSVPNSSNVSFSEKYKAELRQRYNRLYVLTDVSDFTPTEKNKLEQAGLLTATRQEQLDHLYKNKGALGDYNDIPTVE